LKATDEELVKQTLAGSRAAFAALVDRYRDALCGVAYHYLGNFDDAQDVAQEVFVYAYVHLRELRDADRFAPWLRRMALRRCADLFRKRECRHVSLDLEAEERCGATQSRDVSVDVERQNEALEHLTTRIAVQEALGCLSEKTRLTVTLFYLSGYSHAEIAQFLEVPLNTVRSRLQHAKRQLRQEMMTMVSDVMSGGRPDPEFTRRVVDEAIRRGLDAARAHAPGEALGHYDEALTALEGLEGIPEQRRLMMQTLLNKGDVSRFPRGFDEAVLLYERSLAIAEELGDRKSEADGLMKISVHSTDPGRAAECRQKALQIYRELNDARGEADGLFWLGREKLAGHDVALAASYCAEALALLERDRSAGSSSDIRMAALCRMVIQLAGETGEAFPHLLTWNASCDELKEAEGAVRFGRHSDIRHLLSSGAGPGLPVALRARSLFSQIAHSGKLLDAKVPVGSGWTSASWSYSSQPLETSVTVLGSGETVTVPAGTFSQCVLVEQITREKGLLDDAPEENQQANRDTLCGTRRAWYAMGVGLVQLCTRDTVGTEELSQLQEYKLETAGDTYLPLSVGNVWTYGWAGLPDSVSGMEVYRVADREGDSAYVESYGFIRPR
jgi:RNA polymerase sigma-70 factor (ECF subfamily)